jgi:hypothetical protein
MQKFVLDREWFEQGWLDRVLERCPVEVEAMSTCWLWHVRCEVPMWHSAFRALSSVALPFC